VKKGKQPAAKDRSVGARVERELSPLENQAIDALRRARRLPIGAERNDLRQLAMGLLWLHRNGMDALMEERSQLANRDRSLARLPPYR
jgi:hypothetical protein